jgi:NAD(P)-dependent dehydrogenase (short-subunit alcohol dehydrogenase family)
MNRSVEGMNRLEGRIALITAAGSGMGRASAERFAAEGAHVIVADLNGKAADEVRDAIAATGGSAESAACDVGDLDALKALVDRIERDHGVLHILFNHAGIPGGGGGDFGLDVDLDGWEKLVDVNMRSAFYLTGYALPLLRKAEGKASIIFTSSVSGIVGSPLSPLYSLSKGGINLLMKSLAVRLGPHGIRSNSICPAMIETPMLSQFFGREKGADIEDLKSAYKGNVPLARAGHPSEIASVAAFLASDDASWVTGVALPVDGGFLAQ